MWREELGLVEMLLTYIGDFAKFESYADWRPVLVDILSSHEEVRRRRLAEAIEYSGRERMKDDEVKNFVYETRQPSGSGYASLQIPTEERNNEYSQSLVQCSHNVDLEEDNFIESNRMIPRTSEYVNDTINVEDNVVMKKETVAQRRESEMSEESIVCLEMETRGDLSECGNVTGAPEIANFAGISEGNEQETRHGQTNENFKCVVCGKSFESNERLTSHMRNHNKPGPYQCDKCDKSFHLRANLRRHLKRHSGDRPFKCNYCDKAFAVKRYLKIHVNGMHFDERPFACHLCDKAFTTKSHMKTHIESVHFDMRPFPCQFCGRAFHSKFKVGRHMKSCLKSQVTVS